MSATVVEAGRASCVPERSLGRSSGEPRGRPETHPRLPALDALRGLAAAAVVLYHATDRYARLVGPHRPALPDFAVGHFGVELFFILSGFLIVGAIERAPSFPHFALHRLARLYPAFLVCSALTLCVVGLGGVHGTGLTPASALLGLSMLSPLFGVPTIDPAHWTLTHELAFYAGFGALAFVLGRRHVEAICAGWLGLALGLLALSPGRPVVILANVPFAHLFVIGVVLARTASGGPTPARLLVLALAYAMTALGPVVDRAGIGTSGYMVLILAFAAAVRAAAAGRMRVLEAPALVWLGRISYPLYLVHETLGLWLMRGLEGEGIPSAAALAVALAASVAVAWAVHRWVEGPAQACLRPILDRGWAGRAARSGGTGAGARGGDDGARP